MRVGSIFVGLIIVFLSISGYKGHKYKITKREIMPGGEISPLGSNSSRLTHPKDMVPGKMKRVLGGYETRPHEYPYQVALFVTETDDTQFMCGGTVLSKKWILTAAHCLADAVRVDAYIGAHDIEKRESDVNIFHLGYRDWIVHDKYDNGIRAYDIAVIRLPNNAHLGKRMSFIQIDQARVTHTGSWGKTLGWGTTGLGTTSKVLRYADLQVISNDACRQFGIYKTIIRDEHICTSGEGRGSCSGDSGGPLIIGGVQVGIVSVVTEDCENNAPSVFTRVSHFNEWIFDKTGLPKKQRSASQILGPLKALYMGMMLCVVTLNYFL